MTQERTEPRLINDDAARRQTVRRSRVRLPLIAVGWVAVVAAGFGRMMTYDLTPAAGATIVQNDWPRGVPASVSPKPGRATLVLTLHPLCACSRATLSELAEIVERAWPGLTVYALFVAPATTAAEAPGDSALWTQARSIAGVTPVLDPGGTIASAFGAHTSGQTYLYDANERLRFAGGITAARGMVGDNDGVIDIQQILKENRAPQSAAQPTTTPVFGCDLH